MFGVTESGQSNTSSAGPKTVGDISACLAAAVGSLRSALDGFDALNIPVSVAPGLLRQFIEAEVLAGSGRLLISARAAESPQWQRDGFASEADWLAALRQCSPGRARQDLGTSKRLGELPETSGAVRDGKLSADQADVVAEAAEINPAAEKELLELTEREESLRRLREEAERCKAAAEAEQSKAERERLIRKRRNVTFRYRNGEGLVAVNGPQSLIAELEQRLNNEIANLFRTKTDPGKREGRNAAAFDSLMKLLNPDTCGCGTGGAGKNGAKSKGAVVSPRSLMLIRADLAALLRGELGDGEVCEIAGVGPISVTEARLLFGEATLGLILANGPTVIDAINLGRRPSLRQQLMLQWLNRCCTVKGCDRSVSIEYDHREAWADGGLTAVENLDPLCAHHHRLKTVKGYRLVAGTGRRAMIPPDSPDPSEMDLECEPDQANTDTPGSGTTRSGSAGSGSATSGRPERELVDPPELRRARTSRRRGASPPPVNRTPPQGSSGSVGSPAGQPASGTRRRGPRAKTSTRKAATGNSSATTDPPSNGQTELFAP